MRVRIASLFALCLAVCFIAGAAAQTYNGLTFSVSAVERTSSAGLNDCPPGANVVKATTKPGEELAVVMLNIKVGPDYKPGPLKRPVLTDEAGKTYNTAVSFVDVGSTPDFTCAIPFRVPAGTKLKSLQVEAVTIDLTKVPAK